MFKKISKKPKKKLEIVPADYFVKVSNIDDLIIVNVNAESKHAPKIIAGRIIYSKNYPVKVGLPWFKKKDDLIGEGCEFSKKGFPMPTTLTKEMHAPFTAISHLP